MSSPSIRMACLGQIEVQGLQGISWEQWKTGKTPPLVLGDLLGDDRAGAGLQDLGGPVPLRRHLADVAARAPRDLEPADCPVNIAAEASAISSASPAAKTGRPNSFAFSGTRRPGRGRPRPAACRT